MKNNQALQYSKDGINWQDSNVFSGLLPNEEYTFYQRAKSSDNLTLYSMAAQLKTVEYVIGDLDGDEEITDWDGILLTRYLAGWNIEVDALQALDIDGDGEITDWDGIIFDRYLAGWNVDCEIVR